MEILQDTVSAYGTAFSQYANPLVIIALVIGVVLGLLSGALPGGGLPTLIVLMGFALWLDPYVALAVAVGSIAVGSMSDTLPAVLLGIPGSATGQATILDGYPLARKGRAGYALGAAYTANLIGSIVGALGFAIAIMFAQRLILMFGSAEFFLLGLLGIGLVAIVSAGAVLKGILAATFALMIALIGFDPVLGVARMTFDWRPLWDGVGIVPVVAGLFAIPELWNLVVSGSTVVDRASGYSLGDVNRDRWEGFREAMRHKWLIIRSSLLGLFIGILPGVGGITAHWMAYASARMTEKGAAETFGKGDIRGVIAPEAASDAIDGGVLVPTVAFSIPGSSFMAIFLGFLILLGVTPGAKMLNEELPITVFIGITLAAASVFGAAIMVMFAPLFARLSTVNPHVLAGLILSVLMITVYVRSGNVYDLVVMLLFAFLGILMKQHAWPRPPFIIALVLAPQVERFLSISVAAYGFAMFVRPPFILISLFMIGMGVLAVRVQRAAQRREREVLRQRAESPL